MKKVISTLIDFTKISSCLVLFSMIMMISGLASCKKDKRPPPPPPPPVVQEPGLTMGNGKAQSFFKLDNNGNPLEIGIEMTAGALTGLTSGASFVLPFEQKAMELTPFDHIYITWNEYGHPPTTLFGAPHLDFHFFTIPVADQLAIPPYNSTTAAKFDLLPPAGFMPASYTVGPGGVATMGKHWLDDNAPMPFSHTMIYGSYNGEVHFVEPMITLAVLQGGATINTAYAQPQNFAKAGKWYPTKYNIYKNAQTNKHYVTLSDFVKK
jgi:hypothetical protein